MHSQNRGTIKVSEVGEMRVRVELQECVLLFQDTVNSFRVRIWKILVAEYLYNLILKRGEANYFDKVILPTSFKAPVLYHLLICRL